MSDDMISRQVAIHLLEEMKELDYELMGVAKPTAYKLMQRLNSELAKKGYITIQGKVPAKYFFERCGLIETAK